MSFLDLNEASPQDVVTQFVLQHRNSGHFLPYSDHEIVNEWLAAAAELDDLLVVLSDLLPVYFAPGAGATARKPKSLAGLRKMVCLRLRDRRDRSNNP